MNKDEIKKEFFSKVADFSDDNHHDVEAYSMQKIADFWLAKLDAYESSLLERIEGMKKDLVTANWESGGTCNSRCHDSGKDTALTDIYNLIKEGRELYGKQL